MAKFISEKLKDNVDVLHSSICDHIRFKIKEKSIKRYKKDRDCDEYLKNQSRRLEELNGFQRSMLELESLEARAWEQSQINKMQVFAMSSISKVKSVVKGVKVSSVTLVDSGVFPACVDFVSYVIRVEDCQLVPGVVLAPVEFQFQRFVYVGDNSLMPVVYDDYDDLIRSCKSEVLSQIVVTGYCNNDFKVAREFDDDLLNYRLLTSTKDSLDEYFPVFLHLPPSNCDVVLLDGARINLGGYDIRVETDCFSDVSLSLSPHVFLESCCGKSPKYLKDIQTIHRSDLKLFHKNKQKNESVLVSLIGDEVLTRLLAIEFVFVTSQNRVPLLVFLQEYGVYRVDIELCLFDVYAHIFVKDHKFFILVSPYKFHDLCQIDNQIGKRCSGTVVDAFKRDSSYNFSPVFELDMNVERWNKSEVADWNCGLPEDISPKIRVYCCVRRKTRALSLLGIDRCDKRVRLGYTYVYKNFDYSQSSLENELKLFTMYPYCLYKKLYVDRLSYLVSSNFSPMFCVHHIVGQCMCDIVNYCDPPVPVFIRSFPYDDDIKYLMEWAVEFSGNAYYFHVGECYMYRDFEIFNRGINRVKRRKLKYYDFNGVRNIRII
jgi:hypothetical protein